MEKLILVLDDWIEIIECGPLPEWSGRTSDGAVGCALLLGIFV
jgi:hypothetical protein